MFDELVCTLYATPEFGTVPKELCGTALERGSITADFTLMAMGSV